jgi:hypothetical protein
MGGHAPLFPISKIFLQMGGMHRFFPLDPRLQNWDNAKHHL